MIVLIGKTASGKTLIREELIRRGYSGIITYTNRPIRKGEKQNVTYHFISEEEFKQKIDDNFFAEYKTYDTVFGKWYYGSALEDLENAPEKSVIILTPDGYRDVVDRLSKKPTSIYIYANNSTIKKRFKKRGDDEKEAQRRFDEDNIDFKGVENMVDKIVYNNNGTNIDDVVDKILKYVEG